MNTFPPWTFLKKERISTLNGLLPKQILKNEQFFLCWLYEWISMMDKLKYENERNPTLKTFFHNERISTFHLEHIYYMNERFPH
jgi:hypothetical protein